MTDIENLVEKNHYDAIISNDTSCDFNYDAIREDYKNMNTMYHIHPYTMHIEGTLTFLAEANIKPIAAPQARKLDVNALNNTQGRSNSTQEYLKPTDYNYHH
jgi:hypothetical protein